MASEIQICNLALSHVGGFRIQSFTENTKPARECATLYAVARDAVLEAHDWGFARKRLSMALTSDTYSGFDYAYIKPSDCLNPRYIFNSASNKPIDRIEFEEATNADKSNVLILTDEEGAELVYTAQVTDPNVYSPKFIEALAWKLAAELAIPLKGKPDLYQSFYQMFMLVIDSAEAVSANKGSKKPETSNSIVESRK